MNVNVHIRNLDAEVIRKLKQRAAAHGRSAEAEYRAILTAAAEEADDDFDWQKVADDLRARSAGKSHTPSEILVRESRETR